MQRPLLSVVVITRNQDWNIRRLLNSVMAEMADIANAEIILADSASTDETVSIASTYPTVRIVRLGSDQRLTPAAGRYVGFHHSTGDLILHLDGDTELIPGWAHAAITLLKAGPDIAGVSGIIMNLLKDAPTVKEKVIRALGNSTRDAKYLRGGVSLYRRTVLEQVGTFNPYLYSEEEAELALRIRHAGYRLIEIQQPSVFHRSDEPPQTFSDAIARWRRNLFCGEGQVLRQLCGSRLFWTFARERGIVFVPALVVLAGLGSFAVSVVKGDWQWFEYFLIVAFLVTAALAIRKRSLYKAFRTLFVHILLVAGTIKGALMKTPKASTYPVGTVCGGS